MLLPLLLCPDLVRGLTKFIAFYKHITNAQPARTELYPLSPPPVFPLPFVPTLQFPAAT